VRFPKHILLFRTVRIWNQSRRLAGLSDLRISHSFEVEGRDESRGNQGGYRGVSWRRVCRDQEVGRQQVLVSKGVALDHRALAVQDEPDLIWLCLGSHDAYKRLSKLSG